MIAELNAARERPANRILLAGPMTISISFGDCFAVSPVISMWATSARSPRHGTCRVAYPNALRAKSAFAGGAP